MQAAKGITAGVLGAAAFSLFLFVIHAPFLLSVGSGVAVLVAVELLWRGRAKIEIQLPNQPDETSMDFYKQTIQEGRVHAEQIKQYLKLVEDAGVYEKILEICDTSDRIFETLHSKPQSVKVIRQYFTYYLETTSKIIGKYVELKRQNIRDQEVEEIITRTESDLDLIAKLFQQNLKKLVSDDVLDLDVELDMLQSMLKSEGLK
ncbi:5-bromo-4-chloroindolyl phosphate hydrolysis family protein [Paenibacillus segetis]|uniref:5-bromo-4-chloroindolyl phosphate hydrolysis protein n=1 Tax=Paenibacillus segetis TaxID=1325360 RepID=A0ABQ1Y4D5_9BACL|nr:5-bromo-4-chloroindolyl phosphate hydrolysis family protein [Paenibacillus segetis]GGH11947.1 hypothetical protein GCM10008013_04080 [Paenibacillus segetis]